MCLVAGILLTAEGGVYEAGISNAASPDGEASMEGIALMPVCMVYEAVLLTACSACRGYTTPHIHGVRCSRWGTVWCAMADTPPRMQILRG